MRLEIQDIIPNMTIHCTNKGAIWASSSYSIYESEDEQCRFNKRIDLKTQVRLPALGKFRLPARALRLGIRSLRILRNGTILAIANGTIFRIENDEARIVHSFERGVGPLRQGWCEDKVGNIYIGEYFLNNKRNAPVRLLKSEDDGETWSIILSLQNIRHIHCVQYDPFTKTIWMGTGDRDEESSISYSGDGKKWISIGAGTQAFRTVSLLFTENYVYWGSDIPTRQDYIYRFARKSGEVERLAAVNGPVHYSATLENGIMLFATTVEGNSEGKSAAWDKRAHIWGSRMEFCGRIS